MSNPRVLFITYSFPPMGGIAVQRPLKFVKYLSDYGFEPIVLTTDHAYSATMDESLTEDIPKDVRVYRLSDPTSRFVRGTTSNSADSTVRSTASSISVWKKTAKRILKKLKAVLAIPDEHFWWAIRAGFCAWRMVRKYNISCVYTTSGPNSTHIAGYMVCKWTRAKWVADFRDPWTQNMHYLHQGIRNRMEQRMERAVFQNAHAIVTVTDSFRDMFQVKYPSEAAKFEIIRNGVDPNEFPRWIPPTQDGEPFTFLYAGILYPKRSPDKFLQALSIALRYRKLRAGSVRVQFAGVFDYPGYTTNSELVEKLGLGNVVEIIGYLSHKEVLAKMQQVDALLLFGDTGGQGKAYIPGKLYEYLFAGRPLLALMEEGEAADIIRTAQAGNVVHPRDVPRIVQTIVNMVQSAPSRPVFEPKWTEIHQYSRIRQTEQLSRLFARLCVEHSPTSVRNLQATTVVPFDQGGSIR